jgi:hypothetical protein
MLVDIMLNKDSLLKLIFKFMVAMLPKSPSGDLGAKDSRIIKLQ